MEVRLMMDEMRLLVEKMVKEKFVKWCNENNVPLKESDIDISWNESVLNIIHRIDEEPIDVIKPDGS